MGANSLVPRGWIPVKIGLRSAIGHGEDGSIEGWLVGYSFRVCTRQCGITGVGIMMRECFFPHHLGDTSPSLSCPLLYCIIFSLGAP